MAAKGEYWEFDHTADLGLAVSAPTIEDLYGFAVQASCAVMGCPQYPGVRRSWFLRQRVLIRRTYWFVY